MKFNTTVVSCHGVDKETSTKDLVGVFDENLYDAFVDQIGDVVPAGSTFKVTFAIEFFIPFKS